MHREWRYRSGGGFGIFLSFVIISVGVIFLLNNLGFIEADNIFRVWFWPVLLIAFGLKHLIRGRITR
jgi:hypothetical protein